jgi:hypothetical protein
MRSRKVILIVQFLLINCLTVFGQKPNYHKIFFIPIYGVPAIKMIQADLDTLKKIFSNPSIVGNTYRYQFHDLKVDATIKNEQSALDSLKSINKKLFKSAGNNKCLFVYILSGHGQLESITYATTQIQGAQINDSFVCSKRDIYNVAKEDVMKKHDILIYNNFCSYYNEADTLFIKSIQPLLNSYKLSLLKKIDTVVQNNFQDSTWSTSNKFLAPTSLDSQIIVQMLSQIYQRLSMHKSNIKSEFESIVGDTNIIDAATDDSTIIYSSKLKGLQNVYYCRSNDVVSESNSPNSWAMLNWAKNIQDTSIKTLTEMIKGLKAGENSKTNGINYSYMIITDTARKNDEKYRDSLLTQPIR